MSGVLNKLLNKKDQKKSGATDTAKSTQDQAAGAPATNASQPSAPSAPASKDQANAPSKPEPSAATDMASLDKARKFVEFFKSRRTIYALGKRQILPDNDVVRCV